jgi:type IV secretion system protein VirB9
MNNIKKTFVLLACSMSASAFALDDLEGYMARHGYSYARDVHVVPVVYSPEPAVRTKGLQVAQVQAAQPPPNLMQPSAAPPQLPASQPTPTAAQAESSTPVAEPVAVVVAAPSEDARAIQQQASKPVHKARPRLPARKPVIFSDYTLTALDSGDVIARLPISDEGAQTVIERHGMVPTTDAFFVEIQSARVLVDPPKPVGFLSNVRTNVDTKRDLRRLVFWGGEAGVVGSVSQDGGELVVILKPRFENISRKAAGEYTPPPLGMAPAASLTPPAATYIPASPVIARPVQMAPAPAPAPQPAAPARPSRDEPVPVPTYEAVEKSKEWQRTKTEPTYGEDGKVLYRFGAGQPVLVCAPLRVCDLELQPGEKVNGTAHLGDSVRWLVTPVTSGEGPLSTIHLLIKPVEVGLTTNLVVPTTRRVYNIRLESQKYNYIARMAFSYPDDEAAAWASMRADQAARAAPVVAEMPPLSVENVYFGYKLKGDTDQVWSPMRVFDDGAKTYIQMPKEVENREQPALILIGEDGKDQLVNYRVNKGYYIVDRLFDKAALILGVGWNQSKVIILREAKSGVRN